MDLEFRNLRYTVHSRLSKGKGRDVVKGVHGRFRSGQLVAIMGPSGAGKSSLLNAISGYRSVGVSGELLVNGQPRNEADFQRSSCYITQEDLLQPLLTVKEAMDVAASLKLPKGSQLHAEQILQELGLLDHLDTKTDLLSGGQKKRLSIALELVNNPPVFFLDEPTSGLDTVTTLQCVKLLRQLARQGRTVVCTIHQPAASLLELFDQVYVLADGRCIFQGDTAAMVPHLQSVGLPCPRHHNPADFSSTSSKSSDSSVSSENTSKRVRPLPETFKSSLDKNPSARDCLDWLRGSSTPEDLVAEKWLATFELRNKILSEGLSYKQYFATYPALTLPDGHKLLSLDFQTIYPNADIVYDESFPIVKTRLLNLLAEKGESTRVDQTTLDLLQLATVIEVTESPENVTILCEEILNGQLYKSSKLEQSEPVNNMELKIRYQTDDSEETEVMLSNEKCLYKVPKYEGSTSSSSLSSRVSQMNSSMAWMKVQKQSSSCGYATTYFQQFSILLCRMMKQISRNRTGLWIQLIHHIMCGVLIGLCFFDMANDGTQMFNHLKMCVGLVIFFAYTQIMVPVLVYPQEVKLVKKEHFNRWYSLTPYYAALTVSKLPVQVFLNCLFCTIVYFMVGVPFQLTRFIAFCLIGNVVSLVAEGMGLAIGSVFNVRNGCAIGPTTIAPFLGLAIYGFDFAHRIPLMMNILMKTSFIRCGVVAMVLTIFGFGRAPLECKDVYCHFAKPDVLMKYLDIERSSVWLEILTMLGIMFVFRSLCYIGLRWRFAT